MNKEEAKKFFEDLGNRKVKVFTNRALPLPPGATDAIAHEGMRFTVEEFYQAIYRRLCDDLATVTHRQYD